MYATWPGCSRVGTQQLHDRSHDKTMESWQTSRSYSKYPYSVTCSVTPVYKLITYIFSPHVAMPQFDNVLSWRRWLVHLFESQGNMNSTRYYWGFHLLISAGSRLFTVHNSLADCSRIMSQIVTGLSPVTLQNWLRVCCSRNYCHDLSWSTSAPRV